MGGGGEFLWDRRFGVSKANSRAGLVCLLGGVSDLCEWKGGACQLTPEKGIQILPAAQPPLRGFLPQVWAVVSGCVYPWIGCARAHPIQVYCGARGYDWDEFGCFYVPIRSPFSEGVVVA